MESTGFPTRQPVAFAGTAGDESSDDAALAAHISESQDRGWTDEAESEVRRWAINAATYRIMHDRAAEYFQGWHLMIGLPLVVLSGVTTTTAWSALTSSASDNNSLTFGIQLVVGIVSVIVTALGSVQTFLEFKPTSEAHRHLAGQYGTLSRRILRELLLPRAQRTVLRKFIGNVNNTFQALNTSQYILPRHIEAQFYQEQQHNMALMQDIVPMVGMPGAGLHPPASVVSPAPARSLQRKATSLMFVHAAAAAKAPGDRVPQKSADFTIDPSPAQPGGGLPERSSRLLRVGATSRV